jgi:hypothetical protein
MQVFIATLATRDVTELFRFEHEYGRFAVRLLRGQRLATR